MISGILFGLIIFALGILGYFFGNISFAKMIAKRQNINIYQAGSKNPGATNVLRNLGKKFGVLVFVLDASKCYCAILLSWGIFYYYRSFDAQIVCKYSLFIYLNGFFCILGHCFPFLWIIKKMKKQNIENYRGGKGVSCFFGLIFAINFYVGLIACCLWWIVVLLSRYVSLASLLSTFVSCFLYFIPVINRPYLALVIDQDLTMNYYPQISFIFLISFVSHIIVLWQHRGNISKIIHKNERKLFQKKDQ